MAGKCTKKRKSGRKAVERREFLVHLEPGLIKGLKLEALQAEVTASSLLEAALQEWLDRGKTRDECSEADGGGQKKQFLAKINAWLIKEIKLAAMDRQVTASSLVAKAVAAWLTRNKSQDQPK